VHQANQALSRMADPLFVKNFPLIIKKRFRQPDGLEFRTRETDVSAIAQPRSRVNLNLLFFTAIQRLGNGHEVGFEVQPLPFAERYKFQNSNRASAKRDGLAG
jgi:hypothetical protein